MFDTSSRAAIETAIDQLIGLLDAVDGDPDLEDTDDEYDPLDLGEHPGHYPGRLRYGIDQRRGPLNCEDVLQRGSDVVSKVGIA
ncbi:MULTISPECIES: hypothetical protein [unclassified Erythrobacter]|uniref:hypothetical protein n=1 Tax=unclassified Erythrobacter TaxID=2633097 RepID=UPI0007B8709A|nr:MULTISPECIES: hypothetical protein [unclassified Erythrobacter]KZY95247.1 hypothetical protein A3745_07410 [Erythrobacter sp. HI0074]KZZ08590.1 hypothetical protein A3748_01445 [Erythrobacter sp. HI0077]